MILLKREDSSLHYLSDKQTRCLAKLLHPQNFLKSLICKQRYIVEEFRALFQLYLLFFLKQTLNYPHLRNDFSYFFFITFYGVRVLSGKQNKAVVELKDLGRGEISPGTRKRQASLAALGICQSFVLLSGVRFLCLVLNIVDIFFILLEVRERR